MLIENFHYPLYEVESRRDFKDMLDRTCEKYGDELSFFEKNGAQYEGITFNEFRNRVKYLINSFYDIGLNPRDKIALIGKNGRKWAISYYSVTTGNFIVVPVDREYKETEIGNIIGKAETRAVIFENKYADIFLKLKDEFPFLSFLIPFEDDGRFEYSLDSLFLKGKKILENGKDVYNSVKLNPEIVTSIIFTSGTTGKPKGVMLSQNNIISNIVQMRQLIWIDNTMTFLSVLPLHHVYECTCGFLCQLHAGTKIAYAQSLKHVAENIAEARATNINVVPLLLEAFYKRIKEKIFSDFKTVLKFKIGLFLCGFVEKLTGKNIRRKVFSEIHRKFGGNLDLFISGGAALKPEIAKFFRSIGFRVLQGYGITECSPFLAGNRDRAFRDEAAGIPSPGCDIEIFDKDDKGIGEIGVKGPNVMLGYYDEPELTEKAFYNGYFLTGDYGYMDDDNFLYIAGRKKDIIVTKNGKNIYPEEVESYYSDSEIIREIVVKSGRDPETMDEVIVAHVYPDYDYLMERFNRSEDKILDDDIVDLIQKEIRENNKKISSFKRIRYFVIHHQEFEKTTTRKIKRFLIEDKGEKIPVY